MLTVAEVSIQLRVSTDTVRRLIRTGQLPAVKSATGQIRITPESLAEYEATWTPVVPANDFVA